MKPKQTARPMTTPSETPGESERRAQDCRAKAAYCKWVAKREPDEKLRQFYGPCEDRGSMPRRAVPTTKPGNKLEAAAQVRQIAANDDARCQSYGAQTRQRCVCVLPHEHR